MQLHSFLLTLATLAQGARQRRATTASNLSTRQSSTNITGEVYMCTEFNFTGECTLMTVPLGWDNVCVTLQYPWAYNVSSFTPCKGTVCYLNNAANCSDICFSPSGCDEIIEYPGYDNLSTYGYPPWTDNIGSFSCNQDFSSS